MRFRKIIVHILLFTAILFLSFDDVINYSSNPEFRAFLNKVKPEIDLNNLLKDALSDFLTIFLTVYTFYVFVYNLLLRKKLHIFNVLLALGVIIINSMLGMVIEMVSVNSFSFESANYLSYIFNFKPPLF